MTNLYRVAMEKVRAGMTSVEEAIANIPPPNEFDSHSGAGNLLFNWKVQLFIAIFWQAEFPDRRTGISL